MAEAKSHERKPAPLAHKKEESAQRSTELSSHQKHVEAGKQSHKHDK
jgi:hypothetical protein